MNPPVDAPVTKNRNHPAGVIYGCNDESSMSAWGKPTPLRKRVWPVSTETGHTLETTTYQLRSERQSTRRYMKAAIACRSTLLAVRNWAEAPVP